MSLYVHPPETLLENEKNWYENETSESLQG